jgi:MFS family permease
MTDSGTTVEEEPGGHGLLAGLRQASPPVRRLLVVMLANSAGTGLFLAGSAVYFIRRVGLSPAEVGAGLSVAAIAGLLAAVPVGLLADRIGPRSVLIGLHLVRAAAFVGYLFVSSFPPFLLLACVISAADHGAPACQGVVLGVVPADRRVATMALMRSVQNVGFALGTAAAAAALAANSGTGYDAIVLGNVVSFLICAALVAGLPPATGRSEVAPRGSALRRLFREDRLYLRLTALDAVLALNATVLVIGMPIWVVTRTSAPASLVAVLLLLNTVLVIALQVRAAAGAESVPGAGRTLGRAGVALAASCALFAVSAAVPGTAVVAVLVLAAVVLTAGELWHAAGAWGVSFGLAPEDARGRYLAVFSLGLATAEVIGPVLVASLVVASGAPGWLLLGVAFAAAGLLAHLAVRPGDQPPDQTGDRDTAPAEPDLAAEPG